MTYNDLQDFNANLMETETNITASYSMVMEIKYNNLVRRLLISYFSETHINNEYGTYLGILAPEMPAPALQQQPSLSVSVW